jgi:hypothetical protein
VSRAPTDTVIYNPETHSLVDFVRTDETAEQAIIRLAEYGTALVPLPYLEAAKRIEDHYRTDPVEIDAEKWNYALCVLPPVAWHHTGSGESFKMSERLTGNITAIYVQLAQRYFTFNDSIYLPHEECCRKVRESEAYKNPQEKERT